MRRFVQVVAFLAAGFCSTAAPAAVVPLTFAEMTQKSKFVLTGEVIDVRSYRAPFHDLGEVMFTDVTIRIENVMKGAPTTTEVTIQVLGGEIGTAFQKCLESAQYEKGEKVLVFLRDYHNAIWNTGWLQGKYRLDPSGTVVRGDAKLPIARDLALSVVQAEVRRVLATSSAPGAAQPGATQPLETRPAKEGGAK